MAVSARFAAGEGDRTEDLPFTLEIPHIVAVSPAVGFPGDVLFIQVQGTGLYITDGQTTASLGAGLTVDDVSVHDVGQATLTVTV